MQSLQLTIRRGETVNLPIRVESDTLVYKAVSAMPGVAPLRVTVVGHGCPDGWRGCLENVLGPTELNSASHPPKDRDLLRVTVVDENTVEFNTVNAAGLRPYKSGGQFVYYAPFDFTSYVSARMTVKNKVGGETLAELSTDDNTLEIDTVNKALWVRLTDEATASFAFAKGVFDIELTDVEGQTLALCAADSTLIVTPEVTTDTL